MFDNMNMPTHLSERIGLAAKEAQLRPAHIATALKKNRSSVQRWFDGSAETVPGDLLLPLARLLGVRPEWLANDEGPMRTATVLPEEQTQTADRVGYSNIAVPDDLLPLFKAWLRLHPNRAIAPRILESQLLLLDALTTGLPFHSENEWSTVSFNQRKELEKAAALRLAARELLSADTQNEIAETQPNSKEMLNSTDKLKG